MPICMFQSTPPHEGERNPLVELIENIVVSIHAPARGRTRPVPETVLKQLGFNPRPRTRANGLASGDTRTASRFQSTPPHEGELDQRKLALSMFVVSIHAPARGRTNGGCRTLEPGLVSIHAPARGRTRCLLASTCRLVEFQSTPPHEGELAEWHAAGAKRCVSIHAPARGRTVVHYVVPKSQSVSIHAPARGRTRESGNKGC